MVDVFRNRLLDVLNSAKNEGPAALAETKRVVLTLVHAFGRRGAFPENIGDANVSEDLKQQLEGFLIYLRSIEDAMMENQYAYTAVITNVYSTVAGRRKSKTRKHIKRRKHSRKHYRPKGKKL